MNLDPPIRLAVALVAALLLCAPAALSRPQRDGVDGGASQNPSPASGKGECPYRPGAPYQADVRIDVRDGGGGADSAEAHLSGQIPDDGRGAGRRYIAALPPQELSLREAALKHFTIAPHIVVERANSPDCRLDVQVAISSRNAAFAPRSDFTFTTTIRVDGRTETRTETANVSCFDQDTPVRLASGQTTAAKNLVVGDEVWNPRLRRATRVRAIIQGTEAGETLFRIGDAAGSALFTAGHPLLARRGEVLASRVRLGDDLLGDDGQYRRVTIRATVDGDPARLVYNLVLGERRALPEAHWMSAAGFAAGDFTLQEAARTRRSR